jgi:hypothetical protein
VPPVIPSPVVVGQTVTVAAEKLEIFESIVVAVAVDVMEREGNRNALPLS